MGDRVAGEMKPEAGILSVSPSSSLSDLVTKLAFRALALRRHFPIRLRRWSFERSPFVVTFRFGYENGVSSVSPSSLLSDLITKRAFRALALRRHFPIRLRRWRFER